MKTEIQIHPSGNEIQLIIPQPRMTYVEKIMRTNSFPALLEIFRRASKPLKELSESYAAFHHLKKAVFNAKGQNFRIIHVGDGAHARTGALFAFMSKTSNISIDPQTNMEIALAWKEKFAVQRFEFHAARIEDMIEKLNKSDIPTILTFVHAHVDTDWVLSRLSWQAAFVMPCCQANRQLSFAYKDKIVKEGLDWAVLSPQRQYQVLV